MFRRLVRQWGMTVGLHTEADADGEEDTADPALALDPSNAADRMRRVERAIRSERPRILDFIRSRVSVAEDAEDIVQDVFYQLVASETVAAPIERFTSWLFTVARNKVIDRYRKRKPEAFSRLNTEGDAEADNEPPLLLQDVLFDPADGPEAVLFRERFWEALDEALNELPSEQRQAFVMHELEGWSFKEMADMTGVGVPTLLSRKRYAVAFLRVRLQDMYDELTLDGEES